MIAVQRVTGSPCQLQAHLGQQIRLPLKSEDGYFDLSSITQMKKFKMITGLTVCLVV